MGGGMKTEHCIELDDTINPKQRKENKSILNRPAVTTQDLHVNNKYIDFRNQYQAWLHLARNFLNYWPSDVPFHSVQLPNQTVPQIQMKQPDKWLATQREAFGIITPCIWMGSCADSIAAKLIIINYGWPINM